MSYTILVIDDTPALRHLVRLMLKKHDGIAEVLTAADAEEGLRILTDQSVDLVLCDLGMPDVDGFEFLVRKSRIDSAGSIPVIVLTAQEELSSKVRALKSGASDYLTKPFEEEELVSRIDVHLKIKELRDQLQRNNAELETLNDELKRQSRIDPLTKIANRGFFESCIEEEIQRALRYERPLSLLMMDIDHFKQVNDCHGHQAGDQVLKEVATTVRSTLRRHDAVGRYGGEEFGVLLPETIEANALVVAERCRKSVESTEIRCGEARLRVTVSVGAASLGPGVDSISTLIGRADRALYLAKHAGRNQVKSSMDIE